MTPIFPLFPEGSSTLAPEVDKLFLFGVALTVVFSLLIAVAVIVLAVTYRRRGEDEIGSAEQAPMWLEIVWSIIPLCILLGMFGWGADVFFQARRAPADAVEYYVTGKQWMWKVQHPEGQREINTLHVPVGQRIKLTMTSEDVIHSFFIPAFRNKMDVLPGRYTMLWFEATKTGTYDLFCAEYCGAEHSQMIGNVVVMEPSEYEAWLESGGGQVAGPTQTGAELFVEKACSTCHSSDSAALAPILTGTFGHEVTLDDGSTVTVDENYLRRSILDPTAQVVEGYSPLMPTYQGQLNEDEILQLILYIKALGTENLGTNDLEATETAGGE